MRKQDRQCKHHCWYESCREDPEWSPQVAEITLPYAENGKFPALTQREALLVDKEEKICYG